MKNLHSFFSVLAVLSLLMAPLTTSTVSLYAQNANESDLEIVEVVEDVTDEGSEKTETEENTETSEEAVNDEEEDEELGESESGDADTETGEQVLGIQASGAEVLAQGVSDPGNKVNVCHKAGQSGNWEELNISINGWDGPGGHSSHPGDFLVDDDNPCPPDESTENPPESIDICTADFSGNKIIDQDDVDHVTAHWNETCSSGDNWCDGADINRDGFVGIEDLNLVLSDFGQVCVEETTNQTIEVCKVVVDPDGNIVDGSERDAEFSILIEGPDGFSETVTFETPLNLTDDLLDDNGDELDAQCVTLSNLEKGKYTYEAEDIDGEGWLVPLYNDFFSETPDSLENFYELTEDGSPEDNDNADGVINLGENSKRTLAIVNEYERKETQNQCEIGVELLENGSFENPEVEDSAQWDIFDSGMVGLGWFVEWVRTGGSEPEVASLELHRGVNGWSSYDGLQHAELDGDWQGPGGGSGEDASAAIYQDVATVSGEFYDLSFAFSPRPNTNASENILEVLWEGFVVATIGPDAGSGDVNWGVHNMQLKATQDGSRLEFRDAGNGNSVGTLLDDVSLACGEENEREPVDQIPTVNLSADPLNIESDGTSILDWVASGGDGSLVCSIDQGIGSVGANGTKDVTPNSTTEYTITCSDEDGDEATDSVTVNVDEENGNNGGIGTVTGGFFSGGLVAGDSDGQVLGVTCGIYLNDFLHINSPNNDKMEVVKLQAFLKQFINPDLEVTGVFDQTTFDAVWEFQLQYADQIIGPWANVGLLNQSQATGYVYKTTQRQINLLVCPLLTLPVPSDLAPDLDVTDNS